MKAGTIQRTRLLDRTDMRVTAGLGSRALERATTINKGCRGQFMVISDLIYEQSVKLQVR